MDRTGVEPKIAQLYLTVDDGPNKHTLPIAEILARHGITALFFLTGLDVLKHPEITRCITDHGHRIGNHGYTHHALDVMTIEEKRKELVDTQNEIIAITKIAPVKFRPPYFAWRQEDNNILDELRLAILYEDVDMGDATKDFKVDYELAEHQLEKKRKRKDYIVILMHSREHSLDETERMIYWYEDRNCVFFP